MAIGTPERQPDEREFRCWAWHCQAHPKDRLEVRADLVGRRRDLAVTSLTTSPASHARTPSPPAARTVILALVVLAAVVLILVAVVMVAAVVPVMVQINMMVSWTTSRRGRQARRCDVQA